jgi:AraC-like DNA-binding protein
MKDKDINYPQSIASFCRFMRCALYHFHRKRQLARAMTTRFAQPLPAQRAFIKSFWEMECRPAGGTEQILPKGTIEIIFSFGEGVAYQRGAVRGTTPRCFISGISSNRVTLQLPAHQHFFGVALQPAAVKKLLGAPSGAFHNAITDAELVQKELGGLWHELAATVSFDERKSKVTGWIEGRQQALHGQDLALSSLLQEPEPATSVRALAATFCYSPRQLQRKVQEFFGMSPELLIGYKRYQRALQAVHAGGASMTSIAYDCGYYDQAHFNRDFKSFTGLTPRAYRDRRSSLPEHLYERG